MSIVFGGHVRTSLEDNPSLLDRLPKLYSGWMRALPDSWRWMISLALKPPAYFQKLTHNLGVAEAQLPRLRGYDVVLVCVNGAPPGLAALLAIFGSAAWQAEALRVGWPAERARTIYFGIPLPAPPARPSAPSHRLLAVGRLSPERGFHLLVRAMPAIRRQVADATLDIVAGPGPSGYRHWLTEYVRAHGWPPTRSGWCGSSSRPKPWDALTMRRCVSSRPSRRSCLESRDRRTGSRRMLFHDIVGRRAWR